MIEQVCQMSSGNHFSLIIAAHIVPLVIDWWLGKTDKTKSSSILDLTTRLLKAIFTRRKV